MSSFNYKWMSSKRANIEVKLVKSPNGFTLEIPAHLVKNKPIDLDRVWEIVRTAKNKFTIKAREY